MKKILKNIIYIFLRKIYNFRPEIYLNISKLIQSVQIINIKSKKGRDFYFNIAYEFPRVFGKSLKSKYDKIKWNNNKNIALFLKIKILRFQLEYHL